MRVSDLMHTRVVTVSPELTAADAARTMEQSDTGFVPVCGSDGRIRGVLTDRDIVTRCIAAKIDPAQIKVGEVMTRGVISVSPDDSVKTAADILSGEQIRRLPVVENEQVVGVLSLADLVHSELYDMEAAQALTEITEADRQY